MLDFFSALFMIVIIDLVLAGDNAIVIALAARSLRKEQQKKVIIFGTIGAVGLRIIATIAMVWLLKIPYLLLIGGILLLFIAYKLLIKENGHDVKASSNIMGAIWTIIMADVVMGIDNVLAIAGAAHGNILLVILGLIISIPLVVWGSTLILKLIEKFPIIIYIGSAVLAFTAGKMIFHTPQFETFSHNYTVLKWIIIFLLIIIVMLAGYVTNKIKTSKIKFVSK